MTVGLNVENTNNISVSNPFLLGGYTPIERVSSKSPVIPGNTNCPEILNSNPDAGPIVTFDSYNCFGCKPTF